MIAATAANATSATPTGTATAHPNTHPDTAAANTAPSTGTATAEAADRAPDCSTTELYTDLSGCCTGQKADRFQRMLIPV